MAYYASSMPTWAKKLDALALMRLGAAAHEVITLEPNFEPEEIKALDEVPGWIGDENPNADVGSIGLGAGARLRKGRKYECQ